MKVFLAILVCTVLALTWRVIYLQEKCARLEDKERKIQEEK